MADATSRARPTDAQELVVTVAEALGVRLLPEDVPFVAAGFADHRRRVGLLLDSDLENTPPATTFRASHDG